MPVLVILNGAPGAGKSTVAALLAARRPLALALDVDQLKHSLGGWADDPERSGLQARRLALALTERHLRDGHDVFIGQYLARTAFLEELEALAARVAAPFREFLLGLPAAELTERLTRRRASPTRPEHAINGPLTDPADAAPLLTGLAPLLKLRPATVVVSASGRPEDVADRIAAHLS